MSQQNLVGKLLKKARKSIKMSLKEAAKLSGFRNYQTLSKIEKGERSVKALELSKLADVYARDISFFLSLSSKEISFSVSWRKSNNMKLEKEEQRLKTLLERYLSLEKSLEISEPSKIALPIIDEKQLSFEKAANYGEVFSKMLGLGNRPSLSLSESLEVDLNIPIFYINLPEGSSAATISCDEISAICVNDQEAPWRRNFNLAHEMFHLVYPSKRYVSCGQNDTTNIEKWANSFASGLLLPSDETNEFMKKQMKSNTLTILSILIEAKELGVSIDTLLWRLLNLGWLERSTVTELLHSQKLRKKDRQIRSRILWYTPFISTRFVSMVFRAVIIGILSRSKAADYLMINLAELDDVFLKEGFDPDEDYSIEVRTP